MKSSKSSYSFDDTEEFIEQKYPVDIQYALSIECTVTQNGWRPVSLREMLQTRSLLLANKDLDFSIAECGVPVPYEVRWKVLNRGEDAERRNKIRGQIIDSNRADVRHEQTEFQGDHLVECYVLQNRIVVARDRLQVPISANPSSRYGDL
ncbi:nucleotide-binding domain-containing protein [Corynebacterium flavescens]|uniref:Adenylyl/Guanylyl and SMODS C-terminal sensor domain-containing protein n=1 Tax=Corynebacterium flavescens TaxID=28028 RepID=A0AB73B512_CORFL|nr:hypothetical protein [Corynebacterium flavescens]GEB97025.1 hypothetical protein CFL01nite_05200 [Corynebacterium flavescens]